MFQSDGSEAKDPQRMSLSERAQAKISKTKTSRQRLQMKSKAFLVRENVRRANRSKWLLGSAPVPSERMAACRGAARALEMNARACRDGARALEMAPWCCQSAPKRKLSSASSQATATPRTVFKKLANFNEIPKLLCLLGPSHWLTNCSKWFFKDFLISYQSQSPVS